MAPASKSVKAPTVHYAVVKRTSIGGKHMPLNKHKRRNWKAYRGQGRP